MIEKIENSRQLIKNYFNNKKVTNGLLSNLNKLKIIENNNCIKIIELLKYCTPYLNNNCYRESLYHVLNNLYEVPICSVCNINNLKFNNYFKGYRTSCSRECSYKNIENINKRKQTLLNRYGAENPSQVKEIQEKRKQTFINRYGVENPFQVEEFKEKSKQTLLDRYGVEHSQQNINIKNKTKQTCIERYGTIHPLQNKEIQEKVKQTNLSNFGVEYGFQSDIVKLKIKQTNLNKRGVEYPTQSLDVINKRKQNTLDKYGVEHHTQIKEFNKRIQISYKKTLFKKLLVNKERLNNCIPLFELDEFLNNNISDNYRWKWQCTICKTIFCDSIENGTSPVCPKCYNNYGSNLQKEIYDFLNQYNILTYSNNRQFGFEIDLFLKEYNVGIEFNGNYWHSDLRGKDKYYHLNKTLEAGKSGIQLVHIFEDDWKYRQDIVKNIILDKLNLIDNNISNLDIYQIKNDYAAEFLNNNCINSSINQDNIIHYGLCTQEDIYYLISVDISNNKIIRYCSKLNYKVSNDDVSKLIAHICKEYNLTNLTVYCDLRYDAGELFKTIGFNYLKFKHPTYDFVSKKNYQTRINKENLIFENYDDKLSTWYNAMNNNYDRIWNCGFLIYEYKL